MSAPRDPGLTTEAAIVVTFLLGVLAVDQAVLASAIAVVVTILLASRSRLHGWISDSLTEDEFRDALVLLGAALVVLPLAPNRALGPNGLFNPFTVWRLVVIAMSLQAAGHVALRWAGPRAGLPISGFLSGFVSSTATIGVLGARARKQPELSSAAIAGGVLSNVATVVFVAIVVAATSLDVLRQLVVPLLSAGAAAIAYGAIFTLRARRDPSATDHTGIGGRAFDFKVAIGLALTVSAILALAAILQGRLGDRGLLLATALGGFADAQAPAISASSLAAGGRVDAAQAALAVLVALSTNSVSKLVVAWTTGGRRYATVVSLGVIGIVAAAWAGWLIAAT